MAPPSGRRPGADAPPCPPLATPLFMTTLLNLVKLLCLFVFRTQIVVFVSKAKVIPGWDYEADSAREESLLARRIWIESGKPDAGIEYDNMKRCRVPYHCLL